MRGRCDHLESLSRWLPSPWHNGKTTSLYFQHRYSDIVKWYEEMAGIYPQLATFVPSIGKSVEGRDQPAFHITATQGKEDVNKIYFQCQIHASEQSNSACMGHSGLVLEIIAGESISGATCMYIAHHLLTSYGSENRVRGRVMLLPLCVFFVLYCGNCEGNKFAGVGRVYLHCLHES